MRTDDGKLIALLGNGNGTSQSDWPVFQENVQHTGGLAADEDFDGLADAWETAYFASLDMTNNGSKDSDADGLTDTQEYLYGTSPVSADTDGDGFDDQHEINAFFDPCDPEDHPVPGKERWSFAADGCIYAPPAVGPDGTIYIGSDDNRLYALQADGSEK